MFSTWQVQGGAVAPPRFCFLKIFVRCNTRGIRKKESVRSLNQIKSNQYSFNWQNTTTDTDAKVVYIIPNHN